jgi:hypothetical protein
MNGIWPKTQAIQSLVPPHEVKIKVLTGASAGGMSAAILASMLGDEVVHITAWSYPTPSGNRLYDAWVGAIDIAALCLTIDLDADTAAPVTSLLDSTIIDAIASNAFSPPYGARRRRYLDDPLQIGLSIANLNGVPHVIEMVTSTDPPGTKGLNIRVHQDYREFYLTTSGTLGSGLKLQSNDRTNWDILQETAKATGAFPIGLVPRVTTRDLADYDLRTWCIPKTSCDETDKRCYVPQYIKPAWITTPTHYSFLTVDGGTMNNTPTELARARLLGQDCQGLEKRDEFADKGLLLVVPFPALSTTVTNFQIDQHKKDLDLLS